MWSAMRLSPIFQKLVILGQSHHLSENESFVAGLTDHREKWPCTHGFTALLSCIFYGRMNNWSLKEIKTRGVVFWII